MKRLNTIWAALLCVMLLVGCGAAQVQPSAPASQPTASSSQPPVVSSEQSSAPSSEPPSSSSQPPTEDVEISALYATDEVLSGYDSYEEFIEFDDTDYPKIVITTNVTLQNFAFIEVGYREEAESIVFYESNTLHSLSELSPEKPFVVTWMEQGVIPHRGVTYSDEYGTQKYYAISMSGEDGSLLLTEFAPEGT